MDLDPDEVAQLAEELAEQLRVLSKNLVELNYKIREKDVLILKQEILIDALKAGLLPPKRSKE